MRTSIVAILMAGLVFGGCAAMDPQGAAKQHANAYYGRPYEQLDADEKMRLENHLARQNNQAWRTNAQVASGFGRLLQGVGVLLIGVK